jgi:hypothetical protein
MGVSCFFVLNEIMQHKREHYNSEVKYMASRKSVISFGMVAIPISMYTATQDNDIHFNQLHKDDHSPRVLYISYLISLH